MAICDFIDNVNLLTGVEAAAGNNHPVESTRWLINQPLKSTDRMISQPLKSTDRMISQPLKSTNRLISQSLDLHHAVLAL